MYMFNLETTLNFQHLVNTLFFFTFAIPLDHIYCNTYTHFLVPFIFSTASHVHNEMCFFHKNAFAIYLQNGWQ